MTRRPVVNREELFSVANELAGQGRQVTALAILAKLGGGSLTTIYKYLEEWEQQHQSAPPPTGDELPDRVKQSFMNVWKLASAEASSEVSRLKLETEQLQQKLHTLQLEVDKTNSCPHRWVPRQYRFAPSARTAPR